MDQSKPTMQYVKLGNSGLQVSRLIMGTMQYGSKDWQPWTLNAETATVHIKMAYELGIQTFDTADVYSNGITEVILGNAIRTLNLPREEIVVMTKLQKVVGRNNGDWHFGPGRNVNDTGFGNQGGLSRKHIFAAVKNSLSRLQLEYIDVLQCHGFDNETPISETMTALNDVVAAGYVRYVGMSACYAWQFHQMQNYAITHNLKPFISMQNQYNLIYRDDEPELYPTLKLFGVGSIPFSPLARGYLARPFDKDNLTDRAKTDVFYPLYERGPWKHDQLVIHSIENIAAKKGVSMSQVALAWVLHQPGVTAPVIGFTTAEQLSDLIGALSVNFTEHELEILEKHYRPRPAKLFKMALSL
ncbi:aryl-alcohol dehydrogenase [Collybia nuda]|uniref:Aryl-alcohol dehydrogenase n=1 Tax=Collybia nuda TaxID=64659 RepID=A0A9P5YI29_9AGAR|nr:aryl-alcohol dehydrogenase [Collybia nuda]